MTPNMKKFIKANKVSKVIRGVNLTHEGMRS